MLFSKKCVVCGCWKKDGHNFCRIANEPNKFGTVTIRPDLRENMYHYAPIFVLLYEEV